MAFSKEIKHQVIREQNHRCAVLDIEVDVLEGHHAYPVCRGGSNDRHNCIEVAGYNSYSVYGLPVENVHKRLDKLAIEDNIFLHPDTLEFVTRDQMPIDCFRRKR